MERKGQEKGREMSLRRGEKDWEEE